MAAGSYGRSQSGNPSTKSVDVKAQPTVSNNGTNPSNKHWKSRSAGKTVQPIGGAAPAGKPAKTDGGTVKMNAGAKRHFGGNKVGKLGMTGY